MGLSDVVGHAGLAGLTVVAMVLFMIAFTAVVVRTFAPGRKRELDEASRLPLDGECTGPTSPGADA
jgi:cbb3-type cytochrome oxidase subunit 3